MQNNQITQHKYQNYNTTDELIEGYCRRAIDEEDENIGAASKIIAPD